MARNLREQNCLCLPGRMDGATVPRLSHGEQVEQAEYRSPPSVFLCPVDWEAPRTILVACRHELAKSASGYFSYKNGFGK